MFKKVVKVVTEEINIKYVDIIVPVRYEEDYIPNNFPLRTGDSWSATVNIDTGKILNWPADVTEEKHLYLKVVDMGTYTLYNDDMVEIAKIEGYVPNGLIPGEYGDYIDLEISKDGVILNWPKNPDMSEFFKDNDDY